MRKRYTSLPSEADLARIVPAHMVEFELSDKEVGTLRRHIYAINRDGIRKFRTMRDGALVLVWRIK